jgi:hypothetical protein
MSFRKPLFAILIATSIFAGGSVARASFIYAYSGNSFTTSVASPGANAGALAGADVSGQFTLASALGSNFNGLISPTQFSFSGGPFAINNFDATNYSFDIQTSNTGAIVDWTILASMSSSFASLTIATSNARDMASSLGPTTLLSGSNGSNPGTWSVSDPPSATPVPAALPLFASGLVGLGLFDWLRKRRRARFADASERLFA